MGPTASGKSALALELAERSGGELLCFDSTTVYRGLDIGTAKPDAGDRARCPHHLLDLVEAGTPFTLANFLEHAEQALADVQARGRQPILVGGTYLYVRAFLEGFQPPSVPPDEEFRRWAAGQPLTELVAELLERDPGTTVDRKNPRRVIRALEVLRAGHINESVQSPRKEEIRKLGLQAEPAWLRERIERRTQQMFLLGLQEEVQRLCQKGLTQWLLGLRVIGYSEVIASLDQPMPQGEVVRNVVDATWRLAKKQRTWGRSEANVRWLAAADPALAEQAWDWLTTPQTDNGANLS